MKRSKVIVRSLIGLALVAAITVPLVQKLSIDLVQLQLRERIIRDDATVGEIAEAFAVPPETLVRRLDLSAQGSKASGLTLVDIARLTGRPLRDVKRDVVDVAFGEQARDAYGWTIFGLAEPDGASNAR